MSKDKIVEEKEFEIDETTAKEIAKHVSAPEVDLDALASKIAEKSQPQEKAVEKEIVTGDTFTHISSKDFKDMSKEEKALEQLRALANGDRKKLAEYNNESRKALVAKGLISKADYHQSSDLEDGGALVPDPDFLQSIVEALPSYGNIARLSQSWNTNRDTVRTAALTQRPSFTKVASEGGSKTDTMAKFAKDTVELDEYAGYTVFTDQLLSDSAFDVYNLLVQQFAEALAEVEDQVVLDAITGNTDVKTKDLANLAAFTNDVLSEGQYEVPVKSMQGGVTSIGRSAIAQLRRERDANGGGYLWGFGPNGSEPTDPWGFPAVMSELYETADAADTVYAVFGNFNRYSWIVRKNGLKIDLFNSGVVTTGTGGGEVTHNLITENKQALRVMARRQAIVPLGEAFIQYKTTS